MHRIKTILAGLLLAVAMTIQPAPAFSQGILDPSNPASPTNPLNPIWQTPSSGGSSSPSSRSTEPRNQFERQTNEVMLVIFLVFVGGMFVVILWPTGWRRR